MPSPFLMPSAFDILALKWYYIVPGEMGSPVRRVEEGGFRMKYLKSVWFDGSVESHCAVVTEKAYGLSCWNGCRGFYGREWVDFFPKSKVKVIRDDVLGKVRVLIPYWLFKSKGIYPDNVCDIAFESDLVEV